MTKQAALQSFFESFGIPAYPSTAVPCKAALPYLTYEQTVSAWGDQPVGITVNLWYYTKSEALPNGKAQELSAAIGGGGIILSCDGGAIWLKRGSPWCQPVKDDTNSMIKRRYINVTAEYLTAE